MCREVAVGRYGEVATTCDDCMAIICHYCDTNVASTGDPGNDTDEGYTTDEE